MSVTVAATIPITCQPTGVVDNWPAQILTINAVYASHTWNKKSADSLVLAALTVNQALDMAGITKGRFLFVQSQLPGVSIRVTYTGGVLLVKYVCVDPIALITCTTDGTEFTAVDVSAVSGGGIEYLIAGD
ncbi:MAG: hypothetical protein WC700_17345 [Gemmatimonadaceae bacterium]|jgi:hypothetical protein